MAKSLLLLLSTDTVIVERELLGYLKGRWRGRLLRVIVRSTTTTTTSTAKRLTTSSNASRGGRRSLLVLWVLLLGRKGVTGMEGVWVWGT